MDAPTTFVPKLPDQDPPIWQPPAKAPGALAPSKPITDVSLEEYMVGELSMKNWEPSTDEVTRRLGMEVAT